ASTHPNCRVRRGYTIRMTQAIAREAEILKRVILPNQQALSESVAREFLAYGFDENDRQMMQELSEKARQGTMTEKEALEADGYERVGSLVGILQSKARHALRRSSSSA